MNKSALKKFAIDARNELREKIQLKALQYGVSQEKISKADIESSDAVFIEGRQLTKFEKQQRNKLIKLLEHKEFNQVVEEVAYAWFNRFIALRYMEVHDYLPTRVRALSSVDEGSYEPEIIKEAMNIDLDIDKEYAYNLKISNDNDATEKLFKHLIIRQCNALNEVLPGMFESINDYTMLLFPDKLLNSNSFVRIMTDTTKIPEEDWNDIEIIGWLYQYYNVEPKAKVDAYVGKKKVPKEDVPAKTQLFTPDWIVKYMVENSVGRLWLEGHPNESLKNNWEYYLDEAEQKPDTKVELEKIRGKYKNINLEELKVFDPCMGSGHILVYAFEVLMQIYIDNGYLERDAARSIIENNLHGTDIDDRAYQLAYFAVMMKGRKYDRRFLSRKIQPNLCAIQESNVLKSLKDGAVSIDIDDKFSEIGDYLISIFRNAKEYGSIIDVDEYDYDGLFVYLEDLKGKSTENIFINLWLEKINLVFPDLIKQARLLSTKYDVVITNPPYFSSSDMSPELSKHVKKNYPNSKSDMFAVFIEKCLDLSRNNGIVSMITMHSWMFLSSYEKLRIELGKYNLINMLHLGARAFDEISGEVVQATSFVYRKNLIKDYDSSFVRLIDYKSEASKQKAYLNRQENNVFYIARQENFKKIPGMPIAYNATKEIFSIYENSKVISEVACVKKGLATGNVDLFIKYWYEVGYGDIGFNKENKKWFPCHKGGSYRKWYGNLEKVINWENDGYEIRNYTDDLGTLRSRPQNLDFMFKEGIVFTKISSRGSSCRVMTGNEMFDDAVQGFFPLNDNNIYLLIGILNSKVVSAFLEFLNPTLNKQIYDLERIAVIDDKNECIDIVKKLTKLSKSDWNAFETSWEFEKNPLINHHLIRIAYLEWKEECENRFLQIKSYEEKLNQILIDLYGLKDELSPEVEAVDVTVHNADLKRDIKGFILYSVGCMFGRYSLDDKGLVYAGGKWDSSRYSNFIPDSDNCIPITEDKYFEDDIVGRFVEFVEKVYGKESLEENLNFIAGALGNKGSTSREVIRNYFLKDFYKDHVKTYQKRPIYWLFDSGKNNGMKVLTYMHRYDETTLSRIRTDYLHVIQTRMTAQRQSVLDIINSDESVREKKKAEKELKTLDKKIQELKEYDETLRHMADQKITIDLDDGVKHNYNLFDGLLAKVTGLTKK